MKKFMQGKFSLLYEKIENTCRNLKVKACDLIAPLIKLTLLLAANTLGL